MDKELDWQRMVKSSPVLPEVNDAGSWFCAAALLLQGSYRKPRSLHYTLRKKRISILNGVLSQWDIKLGITGYSREIEITKHKPDYEVVKQMQSAEHLNMKNLFLEDFEEFGYLLRYLKGNTLHGLNIFNAYFSLDFACNTMGGVKSGQSHFPMLAYLATKTKIS